MAVAFTMLVILSEHNLGQDFEQVVLQLAYPLPTLYLLYTHHLPNYYIFWRENQQWLQV